jgi:hypothetical protein
VRGKLRGLGHRPRHLRIALRGKRPPFLNLELLQIRLRTAPQLLERRLLLWVDVWYARGKHERELPQLLGMRGDGVGLGRQIAQPRRDAIPPLVPARLRENPPCGRPVGAGENNIVVLYIKVRTKVSRKVARFPPFV